MRYQSCSLERLAKRLTVKVRCVCCLFRCIDTRQRPPSVADGDRAQHIAEAVDLQRHGVADARIGALLPVDVDERAFVVEVHRLARVGEEHGVLVLVPRLEQLDGVVAFRDAVGAICLVGAVERVDLLAQDRAFERAAGFRSSSVEACTGCDVPSASRSVLGRAVSGRSMASQLLSRSDRSPSLASPSR